MFAPGPPQMSEAEIKAGEQEATQTIKTVVTGSVLLYLSPFAIDFVRKLF
ncbi:hypothetical protein AJ79_01036 [Helicocarpus griseus UAMH5409]|uniref:Mitochondrial outer membrane translocase complex, subunit Tom5 n=1 Tax=Helicocarpus griseus UAMH5409 TaxID=1447875 RepID=A0A2B7Y0T2_9EURO|nr:hypothetical protein AJ79_01036 [Helicocarpus griseus UAMH5409]